MKNGSYIYKDNVVRWFKNGQRHREDGPAVIYPDGKELWYKNGKLHREDGPAVIYPDGSEEWYINGKYYISIHEFAKVAGWPDEKIATHLLMFGDII